jgi:uncharacterized membrane protein
MIYLLYLCNWLELLGLAILIGGIIAVGAVVAPIVFTILPSMSEGGEVMSAVFMKFNTVVTYICLGLILTGFFGKTLLERGSGRKRLLEGIFLTVILVVGIYIGGVLTPHMDQVRQVKNRDPHNQQAAVEFKADHRLSEWLFSVNLLLGLAVLYFNAMDIAKRQK